MFIKGSVRDRHGNVLYLEYIEVNTLFVIYSSFASCCYWGNWVKGTQGPSVLLVIIPCESTITSKSLSTKKRYQHDISILKTLW